MFITLGPDLQKITLTCFCNTLIPYLNLLGNLNNELKTNKYVNFIIHFWKENYNVLMSQFMRFPTMW